MKICKNTISYLINTNNISKQDEDLYIYALKILLRSIANLITVIAIGLLFNMLKESIFLFTSFFVLRKFTGGLHAESYIICFCSSTILFVLGLLIVKHAGYIPCMILALISWISTILIILISPIEHPNKKLNSKETVVYKKISIIIACSFDLLSLFCAIINRISVSYSLLVGEFLVTILMVCGKIKYKKYSVLYLNLK